MNDRVIFNVVYISPIFKDVAETISVGLSELGFTVQMSLGNVIIGAQNIIFGAHLLSDKSCIPRDAIIFNLEQIGYFPTFSDSYCELMSKQQVWDYSMSNIELMRKNGISDSAEFVPIGFEKSLFKIPKPETQDIDVLFYGLMNERRKLILDELKDRGLNVAIIAGLYGDELDAYISRSKIVLNLHFHMTKIFEIVRVSHLLNNKKAVVAEVGNDTVIEPYLRESIIGVEYDALVSACYSHVMDDRLRENAEEIGYRIFASRPQSRILRNVLLNKY
jgi:hypothetical protein